MNKPLKIGSSLGNITVEAFAPSKKYNCFYKFRCKKCGGVFYGPGGYLRMYSTGCPSCQRTQRIEKRVQGHIGDIYGTLKVIGPWKDQKRGSGSDISVKCKCLKCGSETYIPLSRLKTGGAKTCKFCNRAENLPKGAKAVKENSVCGTRVDTLGKKISKNNTSGYIGVSYHKRRGKYRAYIFFQRKQYWLGQYDTVEEAAEARRIGEEKIYGDFLKWYEDNKEKIKSGEIVSYTVKK